MFSKSASAILDFNEWLGELRQQYLQQLNPGLPARQLKTPVEGSEGMSFAQLREVHVIAGQRAFERKGEIGEGDLLMGIYALFEQLAKVSARVRLTDEGNLTAKRIDPSFASIVRFDQTTFIVEPKEGGFLFVAEVNYRPSSTFWVILIMCLPTFVAWLVPIILYNWQKEIVRLAIGDVFERVKNEFEVIEAPSRIGIRPAMIVRGRRRRR
jgi:hypothetical protein